MKTLIGYRVLDSGIKTPSERVFLGTSVHIQPHRRYSAEELEERRRMQNDPRRNRPPQGIENDVPREPFPPAPTTRDQQIACMLVCYAMAIAISVWL